MGGYTGTYSPGGLDLPDPLHVLLVEDLEPHRILIQRALERYHGTTRVTLHSVASGSDALEYLQRGSQGQGPKPNLILLDISMPGLNGFDVLQRVKSDRALRRIPVVMLSASREEEDIDKSYSLGSCGYVAKPDGGVEAMTRSLGPIIEYWGQVAPAA